MSIQFEIHGLENLQSKLEQLNNPRKVKSAARKAARQAMNIARDVARNAAKKLDDPKTPKKIFREITVINGKSRNPNSIVMKVGVRGGAKATYVNNDHNVRKKRAGKTYQLDSRVFYWRFLEFGTSRQPATPFMRPALSNNVDLITNKFNDVFISEIDKALASAT